MPTPVEKIKMTAKMAFIFTPNQPIIPAISITETPIINVCTNKRVRFA